MLEKFVVMFANELWIHQAYYTSKSNPNKQMTFMKIIIIIMLCFKNKKQ